MCIRDRYIMPKGFHDGFSGNTNYYDSFRECMEKGKQYIDYDRKVKELSVIAATTQKTE